LGVHRAGGRVLDPLREHDISASDLSPAPHFSVSLANSFYDSYYASAGSPVEDPTVFRFYLEFLLDDPSGSALASSDDLSVVPFDLGAWPGEPPYFSYFGAGMMDPQGRIGSFRAVIESLHAVPEPATSLPTLLGLGLLGRRAARRRRG
jgi:hypothetical protein